MGYTSNNGVALKSLRVIYTYLYKGEPMGDNNNVNELAVEIVDEMREYEAIPYAFSRHNFKMDLVPFMHAVANSCGSEKGLSVLYYILKNVNSGGTTTVDHKMIYTKGKMTRQFLSSTISKMKNQGLIKEIVVKNQRRGYHKYMVNPYLVFNYRKTKHKQYSENVELWNIL